MGGDTRIVANEQIGAALQHAIGIDRAILANLDCAAQGAQDDAAINIAARADDDLAAR
jgi:hypothetical protein